MKKGLIITLLATAVIALLICGCTAAGAPAQTMANDKEPIAKAPVADPPSDKTDLANISLPEPKYKTATSVEEALKSRRSIRNFTDAPLELADLSQLLWAGQGITSKDGKRTAPSAMAGYPLELYVLAMNVNGLDKGIYRYIPAGHSLALVKAGDPRPDLLATPGRNQPRFKAVPAVIVITGDFDKFKRPNLSDDKVKGWVYVEVGHSAQNIYLQCESLGLGMVVMGGFDEGQFNSLLGLTGNKSSIYLIPVGHKAP